jgi:DNA-binding NarL/FixJ family response regulator
MGLIIGGMERMRVIVADDQPDVRSALRLMLEERPGISVIGEASTSAELVRLVKSVCPDLILFDWELSGAKPKELLTILRNFCPLVSTIALSSRPQMKQAALEAGASDFVCKSDPPESLLTTLDNCSRALSNKD